MPGSRQIVLSLVLHDVLVGVWAAVHFTARPSEGGFYCDDESILKPYKVSRRKLEMFTIFFSDFYYKFITIILKFEDESRFTLF